MSFLYGYYSKKCEQMNQYVQPKGPSTYVSKRVDQRGKFIGGDVSVTHISDISPEKIKEKCKWADIKFVCLVEKTPEYNISGRIYEFSQLKQ